MKRIQAAVSIGFIAIIILFGCTESHAQKVQNASPEEFLEQMKSNHHKVLLDVRTPGEYEKGHIPGAININIEDDFRNRLQSLDTAKTIFVYCLAGGRSSNAASILSELGFNKIVNLKDGFSRWRSRDLPVETGTSAASAKAGMTSAEYTGLIKSDSLVLVDFYAPWCAPCKKMEVFLNEIKIAYAGQVALARVNYDEHPQLMDELKLNTVPYLKLYKNGLLIWDHAGYAEKQEIIRAIEAGK